MIIILTTIITVIPTRTVTAGMTMDMAMPDTVMCPTVSASPLPSAQA